MMILFFCVVLLFVALWVLARYIEKNKEKTDRESAPSASIDTPTENKKRILTDVVGVTFDNDDGKSRQSVFQKIAKDMREDAGDGYIERYGGLSAREIKEDGQRVYEFEDQDFPVTLERYEYEGKPALHVVSEFGCIGNVPKKDVAEILDAIDNAKEYTVTATITGGKYKDTDGDTIWTGERDYGATLFIVCVMPDDVEK